MSTPCNIEAEQAVLGAILLSERVMPALLMEEGLRAEHFYRDRHRAIFTAMVALSARSEAVDTLTVTAELRRDGKLEEAGGKAAIDELTGGVPGLGAIRSYARIVTDLWKLHTTRIAAVEIQAGVDARDDARIAEGRRMLDATVVAHGAGDGALDRQALASLVLDHLSSGTADEGLPVPPRLSSLTRYMRFRPGHTTVISGWSHMGKSVLARQLGDTWSRHGLNVAMWSNEDVPLEIATREVQRLTGIPSWTITDRKLNDMALARVTRALGDLSFSVQPCAGWTADQIATSIRQRQCDAAIVDHLHAIPGMGKTAEIDEAMKALVAAAKQTGCHVVVVCQLNHERDKALSRPAPVIRDLLGSARIGDLAENVVFVHRNEEEARKDGERLGRAVTLDEGRIDVAKCKAMSGTGVFRVLFDRNHCCFTEPAAQGLVAA